MPFCREQTPALSFSGCATFWKGNLSLLLPRGGLLGSQPAGHSLGLQKHPCASSANATPLVQGYQQLHRLRAALPPTHQHNDPQGSWLELRATACREMLGQCPLVLTTNPLPPTAGLQTCIWQKNPTMVKRKMRENAERLFYFRMPVKDKVTSKSSLLSSRRCQKHHRSGAKG